MVQTSIAIQSHFTIEYGLNGTSIDSARFVQSGKDTATSSISQRQMQAGISFIIRRVIAFQRPNNKGLGNTIHSINVNGVNVLITATVAAADPTIKDSGEIAIRVNAGDLYTVGFDTTGQGGGNTHFLGHWECFVAQDAGNRKA